jgi:hypothetical protein
VAKTLRKVVDEWVILWEKQPKHTESLEVFVAKQTIKHYEALKGLVKIKEDEE